MNAGSPGATAARRMQATALKARPRLCVCSQQHTQEPNCISSQAGRPLWDHMLAGPSSSCLCLCRRRRRCRQAAVSRRPPCRPLGRSDALVSLSPANCGRWARWEAVSRQSFTACERLWLQACPIRALGVVEYWRHRPACSQASNARPAGKCAATPPRDESAGTGRPALLTSAHRDSGLSILKLSGTVPPPHGLLPGGARSRSRPHPLAQQAVPGSSALPHRTPVPGCPPDAAARHRPPQHDGDRNGGQ